MVERSLQVIQMDIRKFEVGEKTPYGVVNHYVVWAEQLGEHYLLRAEWELGTLRDEDRIFGMAKLNENVSYVLEQKAIELANSVPFAKVNVFDGI